MNSNKTTQLIISFSVMIFILASCGKNENMTDDYKSHNMKLFSDFVNNPPDEYLKCERDSDCEHVFYSQCCGGSCGAVIAAEKEAQFLKTIEEFRQACAPCCDGNTCYTVKVQCIAITPKCSDEGLCEGT